MSGYSISGSPKALTEQLNRFTPLTGHQLDVDLEPGSPEWLATISASQIATIAGVGRTDWDTPHALWMRKAGVVPAAAETRSQGRGHEFEPLIRRWYAEAHHDVTVEETGTWVHNHRDWQTANPDALIYGPHDQRSEPIALLEIKVALLEIKTAADIRDWNDQVPDYYAAQAQWQMDVTGIRRVVFAVCGPFELFDRRPREITVDYNPQAAARLREMAIRFMQSIELGIEPDPDYNTQPDRDALRWQHTTIVDTPGLDIPDEIAVPYLEALAAEKAATAGKARWSAELAAFMGDRRKATWNGTTLGTRKNGVGDKPPSFSAAPKLADKASDLLNPKAQDAA